MGKVGVVLVCFHTPVETLSCARMFIKMDSIQHIVIIDNETADENKRVFKELQNEKLSIIYQENNLGYSRGNNIGIRFLIDNYEVDYIIISNSDVEIDEVNILECIKALDENNMIGAVAPTMKNPQLENYAYRFLNLRYLRIFLRIFIPETFIDKITEQFCKRDGNLVYQSFLPGSFFIAKRKAFEQCKGFDEEIFLYREEEILGQRLAKCSYIEAVITNSFFMHNHNYKKEPANKKHQRNKLVMKSEQLYFKKYLNASMIQMGFVLAMQQIYLYSRFVLWKIVELRRK